MVSEHYGTSRLAAQRRCTPDAHSANHLLAAIAYGGNCGQGCLSSSVKGTLIYFPEGTYLISSPINAMYYSQLVGDVWFEPLELEDPALMLT